MGALKLMVFRQAEVRRKSRSNVSSDTGAQGSDFGEIRRQRADDGEEADFPHESSPSLAPNFVEIRVLSANSGRDVRAPSSRLQASPWELRIELQCKRPRGDPPRVATGLSLATARPKSSESARELPKSEPTLAGLKKFKPKVVRSWVKPGQDRTKFGEIRADSATCFGNIGEIWGLRQIGMSWPDLAWLLRRDGAISHRRPAPEYAATCCVQGICEGIAPK